MFEQILTAFQLGMVYSLVSLGIYISFRTLNTADLTGDGSLCLGAAVSIKVLQELPLSIPLILRCALACFCAFVAGSCAGMFRAFLQIKKRPIQPLLAGVLVMTGLYSINFRIMGQPNISLSEEHTISTWIPIESVLLTVNIAIFAIFYMFFQSHAGLCTQNRWM